MPSAIMDEVPKRPALLPMKHGGRRLHQRPSKQSLGKASSSGVSTSSSSSASYAGLRREVLYRAMNEFDLPGSMVSEYADLLTLLAFDMTSMVANGQTWCLCRGKIEDKPCQRMVPEVYLRAAVGKILIAAEKPALQGDYLVEELACAFSYAICSEHHRTIHKVVRALESREAVERWRSRHPWTGRIATPTQEVPNFSITENMLAEAVENAHIDTVDSEDDMLSAYGNVERLKVERQYQEFLRKTRRRGDRSESDASSVGSAKRLQEIRNRTRRFNKSQNSLDHFLAAE